MQRANGDWFAMEDRGRLRVPIFRTQREAMEARSRDTSLECFRPVVLDERALQGMVTTGGEPACFWLVKDATRGLQRGLPMDFAQFESLIGNSSTKQQGVI